MDEPKFIIYHPETAGRHEHFFVYESSEGMTADAAKLVTHSSSYKIVDELNDRAMLFKALLDAAAGDISCEEIQTDFGLRATYPMLAPSAGSDDGGPLFTNERCVMYVIHNKGAQSGSS